MHYYDCPCDDCRRPDHDPLYERVLNVIERLEQELERPRVKEYDRALTWLAAICGGPEAVLRLDAVPLHGPVPLPADERVEQVAELLHQLARELFDDETAVAFRHGLARLWEIDPGLVRSPVSASYVASGLAWAIGQANGVVGPEHRVTASRLKYQLDTPGSPATYVRPIRRALGGLWEWQVDAAPMTSVPPLSALGDLRLLTARTRAQLVRVRDHALAARSCDLEPACV